MASTYLSKTLSGSPTDNNKWTWSAWVKRSKLTTEQPLFYADDGGTSYYTRIQWHDTDQISVRNRFAGADKGYAITTPMYRDTASWYHIQVVLDTNNATAGDRLIIYVNGERVTAFDNNPTITQNAGSTINDGYEHRIGRGNNTSGSSYFDGNMTHIHFVDGQAYAPTVFGETDSVSSIWKPKTAPSVTYGTNGFFLKMENSGAMGTDSSGNSNTFTVNGTLTQNVDTPNNNFATLNPLPSQKIGTDCFYEYGNTNVRSSSANFRAGVSGIYVNKGKWYFEMQQSNADCHMGIAGENKIQNGGTSGGVNNRLFYYEDTTGYAYSYNAGNGMIYFSTPSDGTQTASYGNAFGSSDTVGCFADLDNNKLYFSKNGTIQNSGTGYTIQGDIYYALGSSIYNGDTSLNYGNGSFKGVKLTGTTFADANGQGIFKYSPNQGGASNFDSAAKNFYTLNTKNLKEFG